jgi:ERCC4-type nuclease
MTLTNSQVRIFIDNREHSLISDSQLNNLISAECASVKPLDVGDIQILCNDNIKVVIERKTIEDLISSIKDGRYKEQKLRLLQTREETGCVLVYIIEKSPRINAHRGLFMDMSAGVVGAIINTCIRDHIFVLQTQSVEDTASLIQGMFSRIQKDPSTYFPTIGLNETHDLSKETHTDALIKTKRKGNIDEHTCFLMQLSCVPGISMKKASALAEHFNTSTMGGLLSQLKPGKDGIKQLGNVDGIGKVLAKTIIQHLLPV